LKLPRKRRVTFAESAVVDLEEMRAWYADQQVPDVGERFVGEIIAAVERLADFPESGRVVPELDDPQLREIIHPSFRIVYRLDAERARIVRVWRGERLLELE
jgi:plasmid stabilization system protein ParE